jgi:dCTP deaminase
MFSDQDIHNFGYTRDILINGEPPEWEDLEPASLDVTLGNDFLACYKEEGWDTRVIDFKQDNSDLFKEYHVPDGEAFVITRDMFVLATTAEHLAISNRIVAEISGKSSVARLGLIVHTTAGWIDPGFQGQVTLELATHAPFPTRIYPGMSIAQLTFDECKTPSVSGYDGKYVNQSGPTASRYWLNWDIESQSWK